VAAFHWPCALIAGGDPPHARFSAESAAPVCGCPRPERVVTQPCCGGEALRRCPWAIEGCKSPQCPGAFILSLRKGSRPTIDPRRGDPSEPHLCQSWRKCGRMRVSAPKARGPMGSSRSKYPTAIISLNSRLSHTRYTDRVLLFVVHPMHPCIPAAENPSLRRRSYVIIKPFVPRVAVNTSQANTWRLESCTIRVSLS